MKTTVRKIPYADLLEQHGLIKTKLLESIERVIDHSQFILGNEVEEFERRFAELCGTRFAVSVNSGTDALILALRVLGIGSGDEVITVPNSFISTASCIVLVGARPVFVDVRDDYNIDPFKIEEAITPRTKAILPVHLTGRPADMNPILEIAKRRGLFVIEDSAQAVLAEYHQRRTGSFGDLGCFSLHPLKTLSACGDGGVITTNDMEKYEALKVLRNIGLVNRDRCVAWSGNSRLDTIQAACLLVKMDYLQDWTNSKRRIAAFYKAGLADVPELKCPMDQQYENPVYHTYVIQADRRDQLKDFLASRRIGTAIHYPIPIHLQPVSQKLGFGLGSFPVAESQAKRILSLPIHTKITEEDLNYMIQQIKSFYGHK